MALSKRQLAAVWMKKSGTYSYAVPRWVVPMRKLEAMGVTRGKVGSTMVYQVAPGAWNVVSVPAKRTQSRSLGRGIYRRSDMDVVSPMDEIQWI